MQKRLDNYHIIKTLQDSFYNDGNKLLTVIECGSAASISNTLLSIPGASKLVDTCTQLYSKQSQAKRYGEFKRSVSQEFTEAVLIKDTTKNGLSVSFQIQDTLNPIMQTHGWVSISNNEQITSYHISYNHNHSTRQDALEEIARDVITILYNNFIDGEYPLNNVDIIKEIELGFYYELDKKLLFDSLDDNTILLFDHNSEIKRWEEFVRDTEGLILARGSFNPIHARHLEIIEKTRVVYLGYKTILHCSLSRIDKPDLTLEEIQFQLDQAKKLELPIMFTRGCRFNDALNIITQRYYKEIILPVGIDTINRFVDGEVASDIKVYNDLSEVTRNFLSRNQESTNPLIRKIANKENTEKTTDEIMANPTLFHFSKENWENTKFLMFQRKDVELSENAKYFERIINVFPNDGDPNGISSTKIRESNK